MSGFVGWKPDPAARPVKCRECETRQASTFEARRKGGGNFRRASRTYHAKICLGCATHLVATATPGHSLVGSAHWDLGDLRAIVEASA